MKTLEEAIEDVKREALRRGFRADTRKSAGRLARVSTPRKTKPKAKNTVKV